MLRRSRVIPALALLAVVASSCAKKEAANASVTSTFKNAPVILISVDTLRADRLPAYGYDGVKTPNLDALRADSVLFRNAYSHVPLTLPSHLSMLTGQLPADIGVRDNIGYRFDPASTQSLPKVLSANGYATGAAVSAYVLRGNTGIGPLFGTYDDQIAFEAGAAAGEVQRRGAETIRRASSWIGSSQGKPFFYFLHLFEPHTPYDAPEPFRSAGRDAYDGEVAYVDALVGQFLDELKKSNLYDRSIIVFVSDHGEGLGDHGEREHGLLLYREAIHVPLMIKLPKQEQGGAEITAPAGLVDLFPTIASLTGLTKPQGVAGHALLGRDAALASAERAIFSESMYGRLHYGWAELHSMIDGRHHYIAAPRPELYDHVSDANEKTNIIDTERRAAARLRDALEPLRKPLKAPGAASPEEAKKLAALGYLTSQTVGGSGSIDPKDGIAHVSEYEGAMEALARGDAAAAEAMLRKLVEANPQFSDAAIALARALEQQRKFEDAAAVYKALLAANPALVEQVAIGVATSYLNAGRIGEARSHAELAIATNPGGAHLLLGRIEIAARDYARAIAHARKAAEVPQYASQGAQLEAEAQMAQGRLPEALQAIDRALAAVPPGAVPPRGLHVTRGSILVRMNRPGEAEAAWRAEIAAHRDNREAYGRLAAMAFLRNDPAAAERELESLVAADPSPESFRLAIGTLRHFAQHEAAARWSQRAAQTLGRPVQ